MEKLGCESSVGNARDKGGGESAVQRLVFERVSRVIEAPSLANGTNPIRERCQTCVCKDKREIVYGKGQNWIASVSVEPRFLDVPVSSIHTQPADASFARPFPSSAPPSIFFNDFTVVTRPLLLIVGQVRKSVTS